MPRAAASPPGSARKAALRESVVLLLFAVVFLTQCVLSLRQKSATFDETYHLTAGYLHLRYGDFAYNAMHPPLVKMLAAVPMLFMSGIRMPPEGTQELGYAFVYGLNAADRLLFWGRMALLPLGLLLGLGIYAWTREVAGPAGAIGALLLYTVEPNILAHARLVNTDFGVTVFFFLAVFALYRLVHRISAVRVLGVGLALGLALLTKLSALVLPPLLLLLAVAAWSPGHRIECRLPGVAPRTLATPSAKVVLVPALLAAGLVAYVVIWGGYRFTYETRALYPEAMAPFEVGMSRGHTLAQWLLWVARSGHLLPEAFAEGVGQALGASGRAAFLAGTINRGQWDYFFVTFAVKNTLGFLALLLLLVPAGIGRLWRRRPLAVAFLAAPVVFYFAVAVVTRLNIGHRHILPVYPFLLVLVGAGVPWVLERRRWFQLGVGLLVLWHAAASVRIHPDYLAYFNELAGGPDLGHRYLLDSNLDWGQDLKGLKVYMDRHGIERVWLSYFGTADPAYYGIRYNYLPSYGPLPRDRGEEPTPWVAISVTNLYGVYLPAVWIRGRPTPPDTFRVFWNRRPVAKIGYSIFLYRLDRP